MQMFPFLQFHDITAISKTVDLGSTNIALAASR